MNQLWKAAGAAAWGAAALGGLQPFLGPEAAEQLHTLCPGAQTVLVGAFPYYAGQAPGNLSLYCRGEDYHLVLGRRLEQVCAGLRAPPSQPYLCGRGGQLPRAGTGRGGAGRRGLPGPPRAADRPPLRLLCLLRHHSHRPGSSPPPGPSAETLCPPHCRACQAACPTGALTEQGCEVTRCLSDLTQRKGPLPPEAAEQVRRSPTVWGCDLCQKACPHNQAAALTPLPEFREDLLCSLTLAELEPLSNKAFRRQYARRAFSWAGDWAIAPEPGPQGGDSASRRGGPPLLLRPPLSRSASPRTSFPCISAWDSAQTMGNGNEVVFCKCVTL